MNATDPSAGIDRRTLTRYPKSPDNEFFNSMVWDMRDIADYLGINFAFGFYTERVVPNAAYTSETITSLNPANPIAPVIDGTVLFGQRLVRSTQRNSRNLGAAMTALAAHEAGHALQNKFRVLPEFMNASTFGKIRCELCADFICGYYGAYRQTHQQDYPVAIQAVTQFRMGDQSLIAFGHGRPLDRARAVEAGYNYGRVRPGDGKAAIMKGLEHALSWTFRS